MVNDYIFAELIKRGYSTEGSKKVWDVSDSKLWYLTPEQAQAYLTFQGVANYGSKLGSKEEILIRNSLKAIIDLVGIEPINLVDLGCGDGKKAVVFLEFLKDKAKVRYYPIDISGYMVEKAIDRISKLNAGEVIESQWNISDFENLENVTALLNRGGYKKNLFLLLGNTLGNFDMHDILYKIRNVMGDEDFLIIGNGLNNNKMEQGVLKFCKETKEYGMWFNHIPKMLGFNEDEFKFDVRFKNSRLEAFHVVLKDRKIVHRDKEINFKKGDEIVEGISYHLKKDDFISLMKLYFNTARIYTVEDDSYALALCQK